ncbi:MAG: hypothetical protein QOE51_4691 [Actinoplanes sp.]|jgi:hypothetical protein|nr:hypothetical protein [Actinoplanes sp.]
MGSKKYVLKSGIAAVALLASVFVAAQPAQASSFVCGSTSGGFRVCIGTLVNSSGTINGYSATACNLSGNSAGTSMHLVLKESPQHFSPKTGDKVLYGTGDSTRTCLTITASASYDTSLKSGTVGPSGSGFITAGVQNKLLK